MLYSLADGKLEDADDPSTSSLSRPHRAPPLALADRPQVGVHCAGLLGARALMAGADGGRVAGGGGG